MSWLCTKKTKSNTTKSKHASATIYTVTQNKHKKTKARFGRLLRPPTWKPNRPFIKLVSKVVSKKRMTQGALQPYSQFRAKKKSCSTGQFTLH